jgi:hypothetical protein
VRIRDNLGKFINKNIRSPQYEKWSQAKLVVYSLQYLRIRLVDVSKERNVQLVQKMNENT